MPLPAEHVSGTRYKQRGALVLDVQHKVGATIPSKRLLSHTIPEPSSCAPSGRERAYLEGDRGGVTVVMRGSNLRVQSQVDLAPWETNPLVSQRYLSREHHPHPCAREVEVDFDFHAWRAFRRARATRATLETLKIGCLHPT